jgi:CheY-like chemotaxis protein
MSDTILVVDDDPAILESMCELLEGDYQVEAAVDGQQALKVLAASPAFDVAVVDMLMPGLDGEGFVHAARSRGFRVPIILASAHADVRARARELGVADWLAKPFNIAHLLAKIERALAG